MDESRNIWAALDSVDRAVDLRTNAARVMRFILRVCAEIGRTPDDDLRAILAVGQAAASGMASPAEVAGARIRAHELIDRNADKPQQAASMRCIRFVLPDDSMYDPYEELWSFVKDAEAAGVPSTDLTSILEDVFPEAFPPY